MKEFLFKMWLALNNLDHFIISGVGAKTQIWPTYLHGTTAPVGDKIVLWLPHTFDRFVEQVEPELSNKYDAVEVKKQHGVLYIIPRKVINQQRDCEV